MGLDMYLNAKRGIYEFRNDPEATWPGIPEGYKIDSISVEAAYWRKANQIHDWFVRNVQDGEDECRPHYVERDKLAELVGLCQQVLADHDKAKDLLPTKDGFFFGSTMEMVRSRSNSGDPHTRTHGSILPVLGFRSVPA